MRQKPDLRDPDPERTQEYRNSLKNISRDPDPARTREYRKSIKQFYCDPDPQLTKDYKDGTLIYGWDLPEDDLDRSDPDPALTRTYFAIMLNSALQSYGSEGS